MKKIFLISLSLFFAACSKAGKEVEVPSIDAVGVPQTALTIQDKSQLIGGPAEQGRVGDVLLSNDKIRVIIQKPSKNSGIGSFGGTIIDADHKRASGEGPSTSSGQGRDEWGELFPMVNIEWSVNTFTYGVPDGMDGKNGGPQVLRAEGMIDVYDYLDLDWLGDAASAMLGQQISFADRFDDLKDPFRVDGELKDLDFHVVTEYRLDPGTNYVRIDTTFKNPSDHPIALPVGDFLVGTGELQLLIPGLGFSPSAQLQIGDQTPAVIYAGFDESDVSYGYFYDPKNFSSKTTSVSYGGLTGVLLGEEFLKVLPIGSHTSPEIHFEIPEQGEKTITRYFVVGDGSAGSVLDSGLKILGVSTATVAGQVTLAGGAPVEKATVAIKKLGGATVVTYRTDSAGHFEGSLPTGQDDIGRMYGNGKYEVWVEKKGHQANLTARAGNCTPTQIDMTMAVPAQIICTLGETGIVQINGGVTDKESGSKIPARLTIVGIDPSPETKGAGTFSDTDIFKRPFGIVDSLLINAKGGIGLTDATSFNLEPGPYHFVFSHGPEYTIVEKDVTVPAGETLSLDAIALQRVIKTPGFISADFHIHALPSPDSAFSVERRALAAEADGLDILQSSDHDFLTDYTPVVVKLSEAGILKWDSVQTFVGDEITPNHYGHLHAYPLTPNIDDPDHGALDWSKHPLDQIAPAADFALSPPEIVGELLKDPGEEVLQINHIADNPTGLLVASGWLTTPAYQKQTGVPAFVSYADPVERRLFVDQVKPPAPPYKPVEDPLIFDQFTAVELAIGANMKGNIFWSSALPTWFNLLNLGLAPTAVGDSDSHHEIHMPLGMPRNYVASSVDPKDKAGDSYTAIDSEAYAHAINGHHLIVSAGPYITMEAKNENGEKAIVGDTIHGKNIELDVTVEAPDWAWFDTVEIYMNTEPIPAEDSGRFAMKGEAEDPSTFAKPYHVPHYIYDPAKIFRLSDGTLKDWTNEKGKITAHLQLGISVEEDTWVVVVARGTQETPGYRSLFPLVPDVLLDPNKTPVSFDPANLAVFHKDENVGAPAWAFTNPIFIDVDGDTDGDGFPFEAKWVREGYSKLKPFKQ